MQNQASPAIPAWDVPEEGGAPVTEAAHDAVQRIHKAAQESLDAWQVLGQAIGQMRSISPRDGVVRAQWLSSVGCNDLRQNQLSEIVRFSREREHLQQLGVIQERHATPFAIMKRYADMKRRGLIKVDDDGTEVPKPRAISANEACDEFRPEHFLAAERQQLDALAEKRARDAQREGLDGTDAARAAVAWAVALVEAARQRVALLEMQAEAPEPGPDEEF
jgi:hypothetical protein